MFGDRSLRLGEATKWQRDPYHRISVVLNGEILRVEFHDGRPTVEVRVAPGQVDWREPGEPVHQAMNVGATVSV